MPHRNAMAMTSGMVISHRSMLSRATLLASMGPSARITAAAVGISGGPPGRR